MKRDIAPPNPIALQLDPAIAEKDITAIFTKAHKWNQRDAEKRAQAGKIAAYLRGYAVHPATSIKP